uniref:Moesin/ezrin/radixin homolog 1 n=1 Tax=Daphnia magna TaxID=35525 RepID=A0A0P5K0I7_9CRUS
MDAATNETGRSGSSPNLAKRSSKILVVRVQMLDDTVTMFQIQAKAMGTVLFEQVCQQVNLLEADYFGLEYTSSENVKYWLDLEKPMNRQLEMSLTDPLLRFAVKFYAPDPAQLEEEFTRYLFCMQIKQDLAQGTLQCNDKTAALIASYLVQAECGDYVAEDYPDHTYLSSYRFVPHQDPELERRIMENHKKHIGQSPAEADLNLLETARRCELYGVKMHPAKDPEGVPLNLAVAHMGVLVFQNFAKINTFSWAKVRKLSFKRKKFLIKLHPEAHGNYKDVVEFCFECRDECKNFWKKCVEHHGFFRCPTAKNEPRPKPGVLSRGSSFRYTGRTQKEIVEFVRENYVKRQSFQRSQSFRHTSPHHTGGVGTSLSVHPLLPVGDNVIVANDTVSPGSSAAISDSRARSISTPERTETVDVHHSREPRSASGHRDVDVEREMEVESPVTSNNSASSSSPQHPPYQYHQQPQQTPSGVFHSLPRTAGSSSSALPSPSAGQIQSPCSSPSLTNSPDRGSPLPVPQSASMQFQIGSVRSHSQSGGSQDESSLSSSEYTDPNTFPTEVAVGRDMTVSALEDPVSRDSYELLSESEPIFFSPNRIMKDEEVPYILHRRLQTSMISSKSCETVIRLEDVGGIEASEIIQMEEASADADGCSFHFQRSRSFRSLREKTYREKPHALFARARLVEIDLNITDPQPVSYKSLFRPKSIEFVSFQNLPPPDAFSSRDDTVGPVLADVNPLADLEFVPSHFTATATEPSFPIVVDVDKEEEREASANEDDEADEKMCSLMSQPEKEEIIATATSSVSLEYPVEDQESVISYLPAETEDDEALTADDVRDVDFVYQDTLSSTSLEEHLISEDQIFEFVNEEDGLPDPDHRQLGTEGIYDRMASMEYVFQAHVLSRISEHSCDSKLSSDTDDGGCEDVLHEQNNTMSDVSSSFKASEAAVVEAEAKVVSDDAAMPLCYLPPPPSFEETTPVNETVIFYPPPYSTMTDEFPSPPSSIDNLPDEESYSDSSS